VKTRAPHRRGARKGTAYGRDLLAALVLVAGVLAWWVVVYLIEGG